jgi:mono/diheme cytochrome c family protein
MREQQGRRGRTAVARKVLALAALAGQVWMQTAVRAAASPAGVPAASPAVAGSGAPKGWKLGGDAAKGRQVYASSCALCHGDAGDGRGEAAGALNPRPSNLTDAASVGKLSDWDLYRVIRDGGPALGLAATMQGFKPLLPDPEMRDVAAFVRSLTKGKAPAKP